MKKFTKVMLVIAAVFAAVGIGLSAGGVAMGASMEHVEVLQELKNSYKGVAHFVGWNDDWDDDWDDDDWDDDDGYDDDETRVQGTENGDNTRVYEVAEVSELEIELKYDELVLCSDASVNDGPGIRVEVTNDSSGNVKVKTEGDTLKIKGDRKARNRSVKVFYPENAQFRSVEIDVDAGSASIGNDLETDEISVSIGAGEFVNSGEITAREADFSVGVGSVDVQSLEAKKIDGECGMGDLSIKVKGKEEDYNYKLECGVGEISIGDDSYSGIASDKTLKNPDAAGKVELECGMGTVRVSFTD